jgi:hypothetical protein
MNILKQPFKNRKCSDVFRKEKHAKIIPGLILIQTYCSNQLTNLQYYLFLVGIMNSGIVV